MQTNLKEAWYYISDQLIGLKNKLDAFPEHVQTIENALENGEDHFR